MLSGNDDWFILFKKQMEQLEKMGTVVYGATRGYFSDLKTQGDAHAAEASGLFWQLVEPTFQELIQACDGGKEQLAKLMWSVCRFAGTAFDESCPHGTARQFEASGPPSARFRDVFTENPILIVKKELLWLKQKKTPSSEKAFVGFVLERASAAPKIKDAGFVARMKRADNPDLEYQGPGTFY